ncbi:sensor histidine kinase, partial [Bacillus cereus]
IGISEEQKQHIFERFYKADSSRNRAYGGSGLGLAIVKKVLDLHRGEIKVESEEGNGTEFTVCIPKYKEK